MIESKQEFIKTFLPYDIEDINYAQIDLDVSDLSIADILRNVNTTFPKNSRNRNKIASGNLAIAILCKSELLYPMDGLLLIISNDESKIELVSKNYIVLVISEDKITNDDDIKEVVDHITKYIVSQFKDSLEDFNKFYVKFIYDEDEMYMNDNYED